MKNKKLLISSLCAFLFLIVGTLYFSSNTLEARGENGGHWCTDREDIGKVCGGSALDCYCMDVIIIKE